MKMNGTSTHVRNISCYIDAEICARYYKILVAPRPPPASWRLVVVMISY